MSNKLPKEEVIVKCTKLYQNKIDGDASIVFKNEFDGTTVECLLALAALVVDLENNQPEEYKARFRADFMECLNKMRSRQVIN